MKKLFSLVLAILCLIFAAPAALAADAAYELPDLNMTIEAPEGWIVFTRDIDPDDPNLKLLGLDGKTLASDFAANNIYLDMIDIDVAAEITVGMIEFEGSRKIHDFNGISDEELLPAVEKMMKKLGDMNVNTTYKNSSLYTHKQAKFMVCDIVQSNNDVTVYGKQYFTTINGQAILMILRSYGNKVSDSLAQTVEDTLNSITFTKVTSNPTQFSAILSLAKYVAIVVGIIGIIAFVINRARKKKFPPMGIGGLKNGPGSINL